MKFKVGDRIQHIDGASIEVHVHGTVVAAEPDTYYVRWGTNLEPWMQSQDYIEEFFVLEDDNEDG